MTTIQHFSHPDHPLILKETVNVEKAVCYACGRSSSSDTYTCNICQDFFLHKSCAELPTQINHPLHSQHSVTLIPRHQSRIYNCDVCKRKWDWLSYRCNDCDFDICVNCSDDNRMFNHIGHKAHSLTLIRREALFVCDACGVEAKDSSYSCNTCDFWMHRSCASSSTIISMPNFHHHPMELIFSIPATHRHSDQFCGRCKKLVFKSYWSYYCRECTYFVHLRCGGSKDTKSARKQTEGGHMDMEDMVKVPLTVLEVSSNLFSCFSS